MSTVESSNATVYRGYDLTALNRQYSPSSLVPEADALIADYAVRSAAVGGNGFEHYSVPYGADREEQFDVFASADESAPVHVFVHRGYWQELGRGASAFAAGDFVPRGACFVALGYGLAPTYSLDEIVGMVRAGLWAVVTRF